MSFALIQKVNDEQKKASVVDVRSGDTVRVHIEGVGTLENRVKNENLS